MATCEHCGGHTEHALTCTYCGKSHCGDHRLPENHDCPGLELSEWSGGLEGDGPSIRDRRGTGRKRRERVRAKETSRENTPTENWWETEDDSRGEGRTDVLTCPGCGESTDQVFNCDGCGESVCPACERQHGCQTEEKEEEVSDGDNSSMLERLLGFLG